MKEHLETKHPLQTNFCSLKELLTLYIPEKRRFVTAAEEKLIKTQLEIDRRDIMDLRNLRDFVVLYLSFRNNKAEELIDLDRMSAITAIIDCQIAKLGGEI